MKLKTLHVENFGPVSDATVELRPFNMFIGEQSIGKSTLAKLITIFTDYISLCKLIQGGNLMWTAQLKEYNLEVYQTDSYRIIYEMAEDDRKFHIEFMPGSVSYYMIEEGKKITDANEITARIIDLKQIYHVEQIRQLMPELKGNDLLELFTNSLYIPAERIIYSVLTNIMPALALANSSVPKNLLRFMVELNNAKSEYPKFDVKLLGIKFKHEDSEDSIVLGQDEKVIPLTAASSGIQSVLPLLLVLHYGITKREYSSFVIEEPECNLFPTKQVELLKDILGIVKHPGRTLTVTTHSPYLLSAMNNILFAGMLAEEYGESVKDAVEAIIPEASRLSAGDCSVYSLGKDINGGVYCRSLMDSEMGMIDFNTLDGVSEELSVEFEELQNIAVKFRRDA